MPAKRIGFFSENSPGKEKTRPNSAGFCRFMLAFGSHGWLFGRLHLFDFFLLFGVVVFPFLVVVFFVFIDFFLVVGFLFFEFFIRLVSLVFLGGIFFLFVLVFLFF